MSFSVETIIDLLLFNYGIPIAELARIAGIKESQIQSAKRNDVITQKTHKAISSALGDDWDSLEKVRIYQQRKNQVANVDGAKLAKLRERKGLPKYEAAKIFQINNVFLENIETGRSTFRSWPEYMKFVNYFGDDLQEAKPRKINKRYKKPRHYMTFKNIAKRSSKVCWQTGRRVEI